MYRAAKLFTGNQPKAHQAASFERIGSQILRSTATAKLAQCNTGAAVQGSQQLASKERLIPHGKASTDHASNESHKSRTYVLQDGVREEKDRTNGGSRAESDLAVRR